MESSVWTGFRSVQVLALASGAHIHPARITRAHVVLRHTLGFREASPMHLARTVAKHELSF